MLHGSGILVNAMAAWDFTDIYTLSPWALSKIPHSHGITIIYTQLTAIFLFNIFYIAQLSVHISH